MFFPQFRARRIRGKEVFRNMVRETSLSVNDLIYPMFSAAGQGIRKEVSSMPGIYQQSIEYIVEEAQAANIRTSGVRKGGQMPEFLQKPTESTTHDVVESLVEASSRKTQPLTPLEPAPRRARHEPSREVLDELLGRKDAPTLRGPPPTGDLEPGPPPSDLSRIRKTADASVIDDLLGGPDGPKKLEK